MKSLTLSIPGLAVALLLVGCGDERTSPPVEGETPKTTYAVSECGGFGQVTLDQQTFGYCDAEMLSWRYDANAATLEIVDKRVLLNCCGERSVSSRWDGATLVIEELDRPENGGGRCRCDCTFDFKITVEQIDAAPLALRVERKIEDLGEHQTVYEGELALADGRGDVVLDETDLGGMCNEPPTTTPPADITQSFELSACGGFDSYADGDAAPRDYCDAEVLSWSYDAATQSLSVDNRRVLLNCCGERSMTISQDASGAMTITERDEDGEMGRCDCMCVFDLRGVASPIVSAQLPFTLVREIVELGSGSAAALASGTLDLSQGSGEIVIDTTDVGPICGAR